MEVIYLKHPEAYSTSTSKRTFSSQLYQEKKIVGANFTSFPPSAAAMLVRKRHTFNLTREPIHKAGQDSLLACQGGQTIIGTSDRDAPEEETLQESKE